jgi:2'-5' RNA ligase
MPRLFTALEVPPDIAQSLALYRGGLPGARWIEPENYHVTLRFIGDVDRATAREVEAALSECRSREPIRLVLDALSVFGGDKPRAILARVVPNPDLSGLQAEHETLMRRVDLEPETRKFTPHVTLARMRGVRSGDVAAFLARAGHFPPLAFTADRFVLMSARDSVGGGPYIVEAAYPFADALAEDTP